MRAPQDHDAALLRAGGLPAAVIRNKEKILDQFCQRVRQSLDGARAEPHPMLIDTLPAFITRIALALSKDDHGESAAEYSNIPLQHGNERARFTSYSLAEVLCEYQYLREILSDILRAEGRPAPEDWRTMHRCLDDAMTDAATSYVAVQYEVRDMFTAALTHDFRGPLAGALNHLQVLRRETDPGERERRAVRVVQNLNRLAVMISNLLDASRAKAGERMSLAPEAFDAVAMLQEIIADLDARERRRVSLDAAGEIRVFWDPEKIRRSLYNLLDNALKYSHGEGRISVRAVQTHGRVHVSVHNYGDPILPEDQQTLFQPFRRSAEAQLSGKTGWGLGLVQVQAIAEAHGGVVNVESGLEAGTTFTLDLLADVRELRQS